MVKFYINKYNYKLNYMNRQMNKNYKKKHKYMLMINLKNIYKYYNLIKFIINLIIN